MVYEKWRQHFGRDDGDECAMDAGVALYTRVKARRLASRRAADHRVVTELHAVNRQLADTLTLHAAPAGNPVLLQVSAPPGRSRSMRDIAPETLNSFVIFLARRFAACCE